VMIVVERWRKAHHVTGEHGIDRITIKRALLIGIGQCFALWPGMSRSMSTIVAGQLTGLSTATAAEFSFLLSVPTLGAATLYEIYKGRHDLVQGVGAAQLGVGLLVSFVVAWLVIAGFLRYLGKRGLEPFGYYRIALAIVVFALPL
jgi:undecaprenyl-diphosphatase